MFKITHSAGHALVTKGKESPDGYKEWQYTDKIVRFAMEELAQYENVAQKRIDDPTGKVDISLPQRWNAVNSWGANLHIDWHLNAFGNGGWNNSGGTETYVHPSKPKEAVELAQKVQRNLVNSLGFNDRGVKYAKFDMLHFTKMTAILPEIAFMTNKNEAMKMRTAEYQKKAALAVVAAVVAQYGLKKKPKPKPAAVKPGVFYRVVTGSFSDIENAERQVSVLKKAGFESFIDVFEK